MLSKELRGEAYNKAAHRRQRPRLFDVAGPIPERFGLEPREFVARLG